MPTLATQFVYALFTTVLPGIYAKYFGLSAASIAWVLLVSRAFDAVTDPLVGHLSDRTRHRFGRRKPWIAAGGMLTALAIWQVADPVGRSDMVVHFALWSVGFYLGWTMMEIPHTAWASELTRDYDARNRVFFTRTLFALFGPLGFAAVPLLLGAATTEMTPQVMQAVAVIFAVGAPACIGAALLFAPDAGLRIPVAGQVWEFGRRSVPSGGTARSGGCSACSCLAAWVRASTARCSSSTSTLTSASATSCLMLSA